MPLIVPESRFWHALRYYCAFSVAIICIFSTKGFAQRPRDRVQLVRVDYLTANLDSLTKNFIGRGFRAERGPFDPLGVTTNYVLLPSGQTIALQTTYSRDTSDWRVRAIQSYGTHISGVTFAVDSIDSVYSGLHTERSPIDSATRSFGLVGPQPLDVAFIERRGPLPIYDSLPPNNLRRITWLLLTVSDSTEVMLRQTFSDLGLTTSHAGCCDYWIIGPPSNPVGIRFELPSTTFRGDGMWLSIEDGGIVYD